MKYIGAVVSAAAVSATGAAVAISCFLRFLLPSDSAGITVTVFLVVSSFRYLGPLGITHLKSGCGFAFAVSFAAFVFSFLPVREAVSFVFKACRKVILSFAVLEKYIESGSGPF